MDDTQTRGVKIYMVRNAENLRLTFYGVWMSHDIIMAAAMEGHTVSQTSPASILRGTKIPHGHILCNEKWRGSKIVYILQGKLFICIDF